MTCTLSINMDNAAFEDPSELPRILYALGARIFSRGQVDCDVYDANGNQVGSVTFSEE